MSPRRARTVLVAGVAALTVLSTAPVGAQEIGDASAADNSATANAVTSFALADLGSRGSLPLNGENGDAQITVPVPAGTVPTALNTTIAIPAWLDRGWIDVESDDRPITRIDLDAAAQTMPVSIPLAAVPVTGAAITLDVSAVLVPDAGYCTDVRDSPVRFIDTGVDYAGVPAAPTTIADFLPPILRQLTVFLPSKIDSDVVEAALTLTTAVSDHYGTQSVDVIVRPDSDLQGASVDGPFERSVVLTPNTDAGAELVFPTEPAPPRLFLTGNGSELTDQARLLTSNVADLALSTRAFAGSASSPAVLAPDSATFDELGIGTVTGSGTASVPVDQTRLGRSASNVSVHVIGSYTPGFGSITASVGDATLAVWPADDTGVLDRWIEIPNAELNRVTTLDITVDHAADSGAHCGTSSSQVTVDGASVVESSDSATPAPLGFGSLPQALMPEVSVALSENSVADVTRAVTIADGLQRLSTRALNVSVVPVDDALAGTEPAIVVLPNEFAPDTVSLPLSSSTGTTAFSAVSPDGVESVLTLDVALPYATVQVGSTEAGAPLLIASSNEAPDQLDGLLSWLNEDPTRWFGLDGDVLLGAANTAPLSLTSTDLVGAEPETAPESDRSMGLYTAAIVVAVLLVAVGIIVAVVIARRARPTPRDHEVNTGGEAP